MHTLTKRYRIIWNAVEDELIHAGEYPENVITRTSQSVFETDDESEYLMNLSLLGFEESEQE